IWLGCSLRYRRCDCIFNLHVHFLITSTHPWARTTRAFRPIVRTRVNSAFHKRSAAPRSSRSERQLCVEVLHGFLPTLIEPSAGDSVIAARVLALQNAGPLCRRRGNRSGIGLSS